MSTDNAIELRRVTKRFDEVTAVADFDVEIRKGEFFSLLGPSGCGKTTTLRMIAGLEQPTEGEILLEGVPVSGVPAFRRNVNTVFQDYALFPHMNVKKNVYFPLKMRKVPVAEAQHRIDRVLRLVNMEGFGNRLPQQLSGGQRQRIALARSLVNEPAALLLDEPLGALDFKLRVAMQKVLKDIQRNVGITFVYVTHDQSEAMTMSDRIAVMKDGFTHQIGTPDEIYNNPATAFVASFIGDMNFLHGTMVESGADGCGVEVAGRKVRASRPVSLSPGEEVLICVRTERVQVNPPRSVANTLEGRLERVVYRGTDYEATCSIVGTETDREAPHGTQHGGAEVRAVVQAVAWNPSLQLGDPVQVAWSDGDLIIFSAEEEKGVIKYSAEAV
jgi:spermidine/putrescine transport system ATP-binding protein